MCSYVTEKTDIAGSGKGPDRMVPLNAATVYFDHPSTHPMSTRSTSTSWTTLPDPGPGWR